uniref:DUF4283 domain-containing protein n=1 Tax=Solanum tuberosum TaxID=4113 RepID=M1DBB1_SOLTU
MAAEPLMETIKEQFILQTELKGGVKLTHYNPKHLYINLNNEYDHATVLSKAKMYVESQLMRFLVWTPTFKPEEETHLAPVWVILGEVPWHCYCAEVLNPLLSTIGYDEDENGERKWLSIQYEGVHDYCNYCKHHGRDYNACEVKGRDEEAKRVKEQEEKMNNKNSEDDQANKSIKEQPLEQREHNKKMDEETRTQEQWQTQKRKGWKNNQQTQQTQKTQQAQQYNRD